MAGTIFLAYAKEDVEAVRRLHARLRRDGFDAWLDEHDLLPGQDWDSVIRESIQRSRAFVVCLSQRAVTKAGYIQKEIRVALDAAEMLPEASVYIIPARLDDCPVPDRLRRWQWIDVYRRGGYGRLRETLERHVGITADAGPKAVGPQPVPFDTPADHLLYQLFIDQGRFYYARVPGYGYGFTQGHFIVFRRSFPVAFKRLKDQIADYRSFPRANFEEMVPANAPWRLREALVTKIGSPIGQESVVLASSVASTLLDPRYWRLALMITTAPSFYVIDDSSAIYVEENHRVVAVIMPRRMVPDERKKIEAWLRVRR